MNFKCQCVSDYAPNWSDRRSESPRRSKGKQTPFPPLPSTTASLRVFRWPGVVVVIHPLVCIRFQVCSLNRPQLPFSSPSTAFNLAPLPPITLILHVFFRRYVGHSSDTKRVALFFSRFVYAGAVLFSQLWPRPLFIPFLRVALRYSLPCFSMAAKVRSRTHLANVHIIFMNLRPCSEHTWANTRGEGSRREPNKYKFHASTSNTNAL